MVPSGIEPLIPALLARCLNQLGQGTNYLLNFELIVYVELCINLSPDLYLIKKISKCKSA